jgi:flagellar biosynthetic protein FliR
MIGFSSAQLDHWLALFAFPLARVGGMMMTAPVFNNAGLSPRIRLLIALALAFALAPALPPLPPIAAGSWLGFLILGEQMLIGALLGFVLRITFSAVDTAGQLIGLQMGLSFAIFYDPRNAAQTPVVSEFMGLLATLIFLAMNGHLLLLAVLAESFQLFPIGLHSVASGSFAMILAWATTIFSAGLLLSLPLVAALLIANIAMGILARVAPQLNLFAIGFPVTMVAGFTVLMISLPYFGAALERLFDQSFFVLRAVMRAAAA